MKITLKPFIVPDFVIQETPIFKRQEGFVEPIKYSLKEVDTNTLSEMCQKFRAKVFQKAEKQDQLKTIPHR